MTVQIRAIIYLVILFINVITLFIKYKHLSTLYKVFFAFTLYTFIQELSNQYFIKNLNTQGIINNIYFIASFVFWGYYFFSIIVNKSLKKIVFYITLLCLLYSFYVYIYTEIQIEQINISFAMAIQSFLLVLLYFLDSIISPSSNKIISMPDFWIASAIIIWSVFYLIYAGSESYFIKNNKLLLSISLLNFNIINIIGVILFQIAFLQKKIIQKEK